MAEPGSDQAFYDWFNGLSPDEQSQFQTTFGTGAGPAQPSSTAAPTTGITAPSATPGPDTTAADNRAIFDQLSVYLTDAGLGDLLKIGADGTPSGWLWDQITSGLDSQAELQIALEATPQFQSRYGVILDLRKRAAAGEPVQVPTVSQVREYEQSATQIMRQAGLPSFMFDTVGEVQDLMRNGFSVAELEQRLGQSWARVQSTDPAIRDAFTQFYGVQGDAALAAFYLDKNQTVAKLEQYSRAAYTAGMGHSVGVDINKQVAERIAGMPLSEAGIVQGLTDTAHITGSGILNAGITEQPDLTQADALNASVFGDGAAAARIARRTLARQANDRSSTGGGALTQSGLVGSSSA